MMITSPSQTTFHLPEKAEKPDYVQQLFRRVAGYYDLMNDVMSMGLHRLWKHQAIARLGLKPGDSVLDVCCGTGDLEVYLSRSVPNLDITGLDFCEPMLNIARKRMVKQQVSASFVHGDAMALPFEDNRFDGVIISYGLRNVADYERCMRELYRVVKPGGYVVVLDMSRPGPLAGSLSSFYRYTLMPLMGRIVANDPDSYRYLSNSISFYLSQNELAGLMTQTGLQAVDFHNKLGGICAIHWGCK